ncbi:MAG: hypothetical protein MI749_05030 [Desulfovibrionales bacterium]|nr:hypothetical protein [Desulfovibrionales bacterium]
MIWFLSFSAVGIVLALVNLWWRKSIAQNYRNLIEELTQKRAGNVIAVSTEVKKPRKKPVEAVSIVTHWRTDEGFPIDFFCKKKRGNKKHIKMILQSIVQDNRNRIFLHGVDRDSKEARNVMLSTLISDIKLPMYRTMTIPVFFETVCGIRLVGDATEQAGIDGQEVRAAR